MQIVRVDFFTFIAQIFNFIVLVLLLRHFLYKRIIHAMDEREKRIASKVEEAEKKKKEAEKEAESYQKMKQELLDKHEEMLAQAREEAESFRKELIKKARDEVEESKAKWYEAIQREKEAFLSDLRRRTAEQIYAIARHALSDLANEELETHIIDTFIKRLQNIGENEKEAIKKFKPQQEIIIKSSFELTEMMRQRIHEAINNQVGDIRTQFSTAPELICGIELSAHDIRITWSLAGYLDALEEDLSKVLERKAVEEEA